MGDQLIAVRDLVEREELMRKKGECIFKKEFLLRNRANAQGDAKAKEYEEQSSMYLRKKLQMQASCLSSLERSR